MVKLSFDIISKNILSVEKCDQSVQTTSKTCWLIYVNVIISFEYLLFLLDSVPNIINVE